jgi:PhnB protein
MLKDNLPFAVYLSFNGNCRQAFTYYQSCFGGELHLQTLEDSPYCRKMGRQMRDMVICATLKSDYLNLMGTDLTGEALLATGNNISILIECDSFTERIRLINKLAGRNCCSIKNTDPLINVTDRYSINWILRVA